MWANSGLKMHIYIYKVYIYFYVKKSRKKSNFTAFPSKKSLRAAFLTQSSLEIVKPHVLTKNCRISTLLIKGIVWKILKI